MYIFIPKIYKIQVTGSEELRESITIINTSTVSATVTQAAASVYRKVKIKKIFSWAMPQAQ